MHPATTNSALGTLVFDRAHKDELNVVMEILDEAAVWLSAKGIRQWLSPPPKSLWDFVEREIEKDQVFLVRTQPDNYAVATFRLAWTDSKLWNDAKEAGYVYSLATRTRVKGYGVGGIILNWVKAYIKSNNRKYLRLDCIATNPAIRQYYENLGFVYRGQVKQDSYSLALYELPL